MSFDPFDPREVSRAESRRRMREHAKNRRKPKTKAEHARILKELFDKEESKDES